MRRGGYRRFSAPAKNIRGVLLAALLSVLAFLFAQTVFQSFYYAIPTLALVALVLAISASGAVWRVLCACVTVGVSSLLEFTVNAQTTPLSPLFSIYAACILSISALVVGGLYWRIRAQRDLYGAQNARERSISAFCTEFLRVTTPEALHALALRSLYSVAGCSCVLFLPDAADGFRRAGSYPQGLLLYPVEALVAHCFRTGGEGGYGTEAYAGSALRCFPIRADGRTLGVAGLLVDTRQGLGAAQTETVRVLLFHIGAALERFALMRQEQSVRMEKELEQMRSDFLRSISHDLRTPLTGIISACSALNQPDVPLDERARRELIQSVGEEASWLLRVVENLLSVTRVGASAPRLHKSCEPVEEVLGEVLEKARGRFPDAHIHVTAPAEFLMVPMDPMLIVQVLMNLIENAVKYASDAQGRVDIIAEDAGDCVSFTVRDYGPGLGQEDLATLFEPSARRSGDSTHGMGLGLSICRSIIRAHGGQIRGYNGEPCGAVFTLTLPKEDSDEP